MDDRIRGLLCEGPLVALYFNVAITVLKNQINNMTDEELGKMFEQLLTPPARKKQCRRNIQQTKLPQR